MEFVLVFRRDHQSTSPQLEEEDLLMYRKHWQDWYLSLAARRRLARPVQRLAPQGVTVSREEKVESSVTVEGLIFIEAGNYAEAVEIARDCPILLLGGLVEVLRGN
ncbi:YciI family protein [Dyadobacter aurulentus]|uniref:transcription initiation protein n=1 Tax=Dyadobacter sp. UC 10 TaxID=2605428 RepID=UPI0011F22557|nr:transcription initiation protein [Dyadobacter sp. UC 10]KAA0989221.1 transcription initiation protein [Dyadobacter sp. UC 10]